MNQPTDTSEKAEQIGQVIDHLVDALGGEPACTLRRAVILTDIDEHPGTTQAAIMERLGAPKSALNRDIEWLYDYGCITRQPSGVDGREVRLRCAGYARKNMGLALRHFDKSHKSLKNFLIHYINIFGQHRPTLRDAKIVTTVGALGAVKRQDVFEGLYNGPVTTDNRAVNNLISAGILQKTEDEY